VYLACTPLDPTRSLEIGQGGMVAPSPPTPRKGACGDPPPQAGEGGEASRPAACSRRSRVGRSRTFGGNAGLGGCLGAGSLGAMPPTAAQRTERSEPSSCAMSPHPLPLAWGASCPSPYPLPLAGEGRRQRRRGGGWHLAIFDMPQGARRAGTQASSTYPGVVLGLAPRHLQHTLGSSWGWQRGISGIPWGRLGAGTQASLTCPTLNKRSKAWPLNPPGERQPQPPAGPRCGAWPRGRRASETPAPQGRQGAPDAAEARPAAPP
jgi:hypothetical protein